MLKTQQGRSKRMFNGTHTSPAGWNSLTKSALIWELVLECRSTEVSATGPGHNV